MCLPGLSVVKLGQLTKEQESLTRTEVKKFLHGEKKNENLEITVQAQMCFTYLTLRSILDKLVIQSMYICVSLYVIFFLTLFPSKKLGVGDVTQANNC